MKIQTILAIGAVSVFTMAGLHAEEGEGKPDKAAKKAKMLEKYDTDKDGKLSKEEKAAMQKDRAAKKGGKKGKEAKDAQ